MVLTHDKSFAVMTTAYWKCPFFLLSLALLCPVYQVSAQKLQETGSSIERIAEERDREALQPRDFRWNPAGTKVSFIATIAGPAIRPRVPAKLEIQGLDGETGKRSVLVSVADLTSVFGSEPKRLPGEDAEDAVPHTLLLNYAWSPDGRSLLLATRESLGWFDLDAHTGRILFHSDDDLSDAQISPDGRCVAFIRDHALWMTSIESGVPHLVSQAGSPDVREGEADWLYREELRIHSAYWWAPDSSSLAWMEIDDRKVDKYILRKSDGDGESIPFPKPGKHIPQIRLAVKSLKTATIHSIDLGGDPNVYIPMVRWLPNGKHIAFERLSRDQKKLELLIGDVVTGTSRVVVTEKDPYWINVNVDPYFLNDSKRFLWSSERTGFRHLYLYDITGHELAQLTKGEWEVSSVAGVDESKGCLYFISTKESAIERQLYKVNLDGSELSRLTQKHGTNDALLSPSGKMVWDQFSDHKTPTEFELLGMDGTEIAKLDTSDKNNSALLHSNTEYLTVKTHLGIELNASLTVPAEFNPEKQYPVIFFVAGGPGDQIVRDRWSGDIGMWQDSMTRQGYVIFSIDNRGTSGRGHLFEEPVHLRFSSQDMADVRDAVSYLHSQKWVDGTRIGICGFGYGGFLALHGMLDKPILYKAGFAGAPVSDWHFYDAFFAERYLEDPDRNQDGWLASSPVDNAKNLGAPLLIAQATLDERVHIENSLSLLDELLDNRKYADILLFADRRGLFDDRGARAILFQRMTEFFLKNL